MKRKFNSAASYPKTGSVFPVITGSNRTIPDGEVLTVGELVAMMQRGQSTSIYMRSATWGGDVEPTHDDIDFHHFSNLDLADKLEFAADHKQSLDALEEQLKAINAKEAADKKAADEKKLLEDEAEKKELEKIRVSIKSKSKKYVSTEDDD